MSPKKFHEVDILCPVLGEISRKVGSTRIIDLGCGQGYLCNILAICCGDVDVLGIDSAALQVDGANRRLATVLKELRQQLKKGQPWKQYLNMDPRVKYVKQPITCSMTARVRNGP